MARIGETVLYGINRRGGVEYRPLMVVQTWSPECVNGVLFLDGENDRDRSPSTPDHDPRAQEGGSAPLIQWVTSATYNANGGAGTWHRPGDLPGETRRGDLQQAQQQS